jgi:hypothetical protein
MMSWWDPTGSPQAKLRVVGEEFDIGPSGTDCPCLGHGPTRDGVIDLHGKGVAVRILPNASRLSAGLQAGRVAAAALPQDGRRVGGCQRDGLVLP